jgi:hypothetical protein
MRTGRHVNTNLEQISDWLTKILVGVGLVQLPEIWSGVTAITESVGLAMLPEEGAQVEAGALLLYALGNGFLGAYFLTRTTLTAAFTVADLEVARLSETIQRAESLAREASNLASLLTRDVDMAAESAPASADVPVPAPVADMQRDE